jgi:hypothetical protein
MIIQTTFSSGLQPAERVTVGAEIPEPLDNRAGRVYLVDLWSGAADHPALAVHVDDAMRAQGITEVTRADCASEVNGQALLQVQTNKGRALLTLSNRPELAALVENQRAIIQAVQRAREAYWRREREEARDE